MRHWSAARSLHVNPVGWKWIVTRTLLVIFSLEHYLVTTTCGLEVDRDLHVNLVGWKWIVPPRDVTHVTARNGKLVGFVIPHSKKSGHKC